MPLLAREYRLKEALAAAADALRLRVHRLPAQPGPPHRQRAGRGRHRAHPAAVRVLRARGDLGARWTRMRRVQRALNPRLEIEGVLLTMVDERTNLTQQVMGEIREHFKDKVFRTTDPAQRAPGGGPELRQADPALRHPVQGRRGLPGPRQGVMAHEKKGARQGALRTPAAILSPAAAPAAADRRPRSPVASLEPNPFQPRSAMDPGAARRAGRLHPRERRSCSRSWCGAHGERYQIIAGERRWRAAQQAGLATVPVVVREVPDDRLLELALVENIQRAGAEPARGGAGLPAPPGGAAAHPGGGRAQGGPRPHHRRQHAAPAAPAARGARAARRRAGSTPATRARSSPSSGPRSRPRSAREAARKGLSVREVERRVALLRAPAGQGGARAGRRTPRAAEERLRAALGTRVADRAPRQGRRSCGSPSPARPSCNRLYELLVRPRPPAAVLSARVVSSSRAPWRRGGCGDDQDQGPDAPRT